MLEVEYVPLAGEWLQRTIRGGSEIGRATMINFYTLHTTLVPVTLVLLMGTRTLRPERAARAPKASAEMPLPTIR